MPLVSFNIVTFNRAEFLKKCLQSLCNQICKDFEVVIIDDGSTDLTKNVVDSFQNLSIKYYRNESNLGISASRNLAVAMSEGKYIAILDSDDECLPERLELSLGVIEKNNSFDIVFGNAQFKGEKDKYNYRPESKGSTGVFNALFFNNPIIHSTVLLRRSLLMQHLYNVDYDGCEDFELWTRMVTPDNIYRLEEEVSIYNVHSENISISKSDKIQIKYFKIVLINLCRKIKIEIPDGLDKIGGLFNPLIQIKIANEILRETGKLKNRYLCVDTYAFRLESEIFLKKFKKFVLINFFYRNKTYKRIKYYFVCFPNLIDSFGWFQTLKLFVTLILNRVSIG
jgi:glycosyltransferase involved in cell wall biosynthesis